MITENQDDGRPLDWDSSANEPGYIPPGDMMRNFAVAAGAIPADDNQQKTKNNKPLFPAITMKELMNGDYRVEFLCKGVLAKSQPAVFGGNQKTFKTSTSLELAVCLATGKSFLDYFEVPTPVKVCYFTGEGGLGVIQDTLRRIGIAKDIDIAEAENFIVTDAIPRLDNITHLAALKEYIVEHEPVVVFFDPLYLALSGADTSNIFSMGERLGALNEVCSSLHCTPILLHHFKRRANPFEPASLDDLSMAGFAEFAGQWFLLSRRSAYDPDDPVHQLWVSIGGRIGHGSQWGLDIHEGTVDDPGGRVWQTELRRQDDVRAYTQDQKAKIHAEREQAKQAEFESYCNRVYDWMKGKPKGVTKQNVKDSGRCPAAKAGAVLVRLEENGRIEPCMIEVPTGTKTRKVSGYKAIIPDDEKDLFTP